MRLGMDFPQEWKTRSEKSQIALSDILYGYAVEDLMIRIEESSFHKYLWLISEAALTENAYKKNLKERISFYYLESGAALGFPALELFAKEIVQQESNDILWTYYIEEKNGAFCINLEAHYKEMKVPIAIWMEAAPDNAQSPKWKELKLTYVNKRSCHYMTYSKESVLAEALFDILKKLELTSDMESYRTANDILKTYVVSGRHIIEELKMLGEKEPKVINKKSLEQLEGYKTYTYMKRKWQQYEKRHGCKVEEWEQVLSRITAFLRPVWTALCENEIFFDDWMPELGRFLG